MSVPVTRQEFKDWCLRDLGYPVIEINVTEEQIDDSVDYSLRWYWDYHFSGAEKTYYKYQIQQENRPDSVYSVTVNAGGNSYSNSDTVVFTTTTGSGQDAEGTVTTNANGVITSVTVDSGGSGYIVAPTMSVTSNTGTGASLTATLGGFVPMPENIIGAVKVFPISQGLSSQSLFSIRYQIALNDLYTLTSVSLVPYFQAFQHIALIEELLVGNQPIRYNRHKNRCYIDMDWNKVTNGQWFLIEAYEIVDPETWTDAWSDRWLQTYCVNQIKKRWGNATKKYGNMTLPNGMTFNGQQIYDEAVRDLADMERDMILNYSIPVNDMVG